MGAGQLSDAGRAKRQYRVCFPCPRTSCPRPPAILTRTGCGSCRPSAASWSGRSIIAPVIGRCESSSPRFRESDAVLTSRQLLQRPPDPDSHGNRRHRLCSVAACNLHRPQQTGCRRKTAQGRQRAADLCPLRTGGAKQPDENISPFRVYSAIPPPSILPPEMSRTDHIPPEMRRSGEDRQLCSQRLPSPISPHPASQFTRE